MIRPPPDALIRRLEILENPPPANPITVYSTKLDRMKRGLSKEDAQIADRLEKLKRFEIIKTIPPPPPTGLDEHHLSLSLP